MVKIEKDYDTYGIHAIADLWEIDFELLDNIHFLEQLSRFAIASANATFISMQSKRFEPNGVTVLAMLQESEWSIHTYPSKGFAAISCFTCGHECDPNKAIDYAIEKLQPKDVIRQITVRGVR